MSAPKPAIVGGFVLGALLIGLVAVLILGGTRWFRSTVHVMVVFKDSVAGLTAGSPVTFRGVAIGKVHSINVYVDPTDRAPVVQVHLDLEPDQLSWTNRSSSGGQEDLLAAINSGLRAELISQSLVTGEMNVDLDFYPHQPPIRASSSGGELEIPTIPSELQSFKDQIRAVNLPDIAEKTRSALVSMQQDLDALNGAIGPVSSDLQTTLLAIKTSVTALELHSSATLARIDTLAATTQGQITMNGDQLSKLLVSAQGAATQAEQLATSLNDLSGAGSPMRSDLEASLRDIAATSGSLRLFSRELQRNPAATLLRKASP